MTNKIKVMAGNDKQKKWPKEGDIFYFFLSNGCFGYGMVSLGKIDIGPFKNSIVIYIYDYITPSLSEDIELKKENLLLPPIITDSSCWKKGYFVTFKFTSANNMDIYPHHYFKNPILNKIYNHKGECIASPIDHSPIGEESIQFHNSIIKSIESAMNQHH